jgi:hypothetical protein
MQLTFDCMEAARELSNSGSLGEFRPCRRRLPFADDASRFRPCSWFAYDSIDRSNAACSSSKYVASISDNAIALLLYIWSEEKSKPAKYEESVDVNQMKKGPDTVIVNSRVEQISCSP